MSDTKFIGLDGMRGIAALFVFIRHTGSFWGIEEFYHSYLAVDIFFILSGFVIAHAYEKRFNNKTMTTSSFITTRLIRLYPMYFIGLLLGLGVAIAQISHGATLTLIKNEDLLLALVTSILFLPFNLGPGQTLFPLNPPSWSLFYELIVNCTYGVIRKYLNKYTLAAILISTFIILVYSAYKVGNLDIGVRAGIKTIFCANARAFFGIFYGIVLYKLYLHMGINQKFRWQLLPLALMSVVFITPNLGSINWIFDLAAIGLLLPFCVSWVASTQSPTALIRPFLFLGLISYPLYVLHAPITECLEHFFKDAIAKNQPVGGLIFLVAMLTACALVVKLVDEPSRAKLSRFFLKR